MKEVKTNLTKIAKISYNHKKVLRSKLNLNKQMKNKKDKFYYKQSAKVIKKDFSCKDKNKIKILLLRQKINLKLKSQLFRIKYATS